MEEQGHQILDRKGSRELAKYLNQDGQLLLFLGDKRAGYQKGASVKPAPFYKIDATCKTQVDRLRLSKAKPPTSSKPSVAGSGTVLAVNSISKKVGS